MKKGGSRGASGGGVGGRRKGKKRVCFSSFLPPSLLVSLLRQLRLQLGFMWAELRLDWHHLSIELLPWLLMRHRSWHRSKWSSSKRRLERGLHQRMHVIRIESNLIESERERLRLVVTPHVDELLRKHVLGLHHGEVNGLRRWTPHVVHEGGRSGGGGSGGGGGGRGSRSGRGSKEGRSRRHQHSFRLDRLGSSRGGGGGGRGGRKERRSVHRLSRLFRPLLSLVILVLRCDTSAIAQHEQSAREVLLLFLLLDLPHLLGSGREVEREGRRRRRRGIEGNRREGGVRGEVEARDGRSRGDGERKGTALAILSIPGLEEEGGCE